MDNIKLKPKYPNNPFGPLEREGTSITISGHAAEGTLLYPGDNSNKLWKYEVSFHDGDKPICEPKIFPGDFRICDENEEGHLKSGSPIVYFWLFIDSKDDAIFLVLSRKPQHTDQVVFERIGRLDQDPERFNKMLNLMGKKQSFVLV